MFRQIQKLTIAATLIASIALIVTAAHRPDLVGKVINVTVGDTLTILVDKESIKIRLEGIDAPESKQPFGTKSKEKLHVLTHGKQVTVKQTGKDRYGRTLGVVLVDGVHVNQEMVKSGLAWHYKRFSKDQTLAKLEDAAREAKIGLWVEKEPIPPWEWRQRKKEPAK